MCQNNKKGEKKGNKTLEQSLKSEKNKLQNK